MEQSVSVSPFLVSGILVLFVIYPSFYPSRRGEGLESSSRDSPLAAGGVLAAALHSNTRARFLPLSFFTRSSPFSLPTARKGIRALRTLSRLLSRSLSLTLIHTHTHAPYCMNSSCVKGLFFYSTPDFKQICLVCAAWLSVCLCVCMCVCVCFRCFVWMWRRVCVVLCVFKFFFFFSGK